jgi:hypothetical protein
MKLGITVVYFVKKGEGWLIDLHLQYIRQNTKVPYTIYAAVNRLQKEYRSKLEDAVDVNVCDFKNTNEIAGRENSYYQEQLFRIAMNNGCTHIAVLHVDSFPVSHDWVDFMMEKLEEGCQLTAIERIEEKDFKPHSSFIFFPVSYYQNYKPALRLSEEEEAQELYRKYSRKFTHIKDSGYGFGYQLFKDNLKWYPLHRSNKKQDHEIMAGIYGDRVFHLGGAGFSVWISRNDKIWYWRMQGLVNILFKPIIFIFPGAASMKENLVPVFDKSKTRNKINEKNNETMDKIKEQLATIPGYYIDYLRGIKHN